MAKSKEPDTTGDCICALTRDVKHAYWIKVLERVFGEEDFVDDFDILPYNFRKGVLRIFSK